MCSNEEGCGSQSSAHLTEFWKAVQSSVNTSEVGVSSSLYFFLMDRSVMEKSDTYLRERERNGQIET